MHYLFIYLLNLTWFTQIHNNSVKQLPLEMELFAQVQSAFGFSLFYASIAGRVCLVMNIS